MIYKRISIFLIISACIVPQFANAGTYFSDNFNRPDGSVSNGWQNESGVATIVSNHLQLLTPGSEPWTSNVLYRPISESTLDQGSTFTLLANNSSTALWLTFRMQSPGTLYFLGSDNGVLKIGKTIGGYLLWIGDQRIFNPGYDQSHSYRIEASAIGINPTTLSATATDLTTDNIVATLTATDSTSELQVAGNIGVFTYGASLNIDDFSAYTPTDSTTTATTYTLTGPSIATVGEISDSFTITPDGIYSGVITPSDNGAGGTFTPSTLAFSSSSASQTFAYTPSSIGIKSISVSSNPIVNDPTPVALTVTSPDAGVIAVDDPHLIWSPYNWRFNGSSWAQTTPGGGYVKLAFTGSTLGIGISTSTMSGIDLSTVVITAYIDGTTTPITKTLADANGVLTFTSSLSSGNHYAQIYLSKTAEYDRWSGPAELLRITKIQLAADGSGNILSASGTPISEESRKVLIYGDSITEGVGVSRAEDAYSAVLGRQLNMEYAQIGYGYLGWNHQGSGGTPYFYDSTSPLNSLWRNYDANASRLVDNSDLSKGFIGGAPDAVFVNLGINDANTSTGSTSLRTKVSAWLSEIRQAVATSTAIFVISPFNFGNTGNSAYVEYKGALFDGVYDYQTTYPLDGRLFTLDLESSGYYTVAANSGDALHPNEVGSNLLGIELASLAKPLIPIISASPVAISNGLGSTIQLSGISTAWSASSTFSLSGVDNVEITNKHVIDANHVRLTLSGGVATGTLLIRDDDSGATTSVEIFQQIQTVDAIPQSGGGRGGTRKTIATSMDESTLLSTLKTLIAALYSKGATVPSSVLGLISPETTTVNADIIAPSLTSCPDLKFGTVSPCVSLLQYYLNTHGYPVAVSGIGSLGKETNYFGILTQQALSRFQKAKGISPAKGYFGTTTKALIQAASL